ncbi:MAG: hypothetical protein QOD56_1474 [Gammaproteobacteria bacterium]|nr:hypothetical protein [Gammaproteobacteria bacterium]
MCRSLGHLGFCIFIGYLADAFFAAWMNAARLRVRVTRRNDPMTGVFNCRISGGQDVARTPLTLPNVARSSALRRQACFIALYGAALELRSDIIHAGLELYQGRRAARRWAVL